MKKYRIIKVGFNEFHVQEKFLFWWNTWICDCDFMASDTPCKYKSTDDARKAIEKHSYIEEVIEYI